MKASSTTEAISAESSFHMKSRSAFTLIEILVVVAIMGFLVALVAPRYAGVVDDSRYRIDRSQMQMIKRASLEFYKDVGFVPDNVSLLIYPFENCVVYESSWDDSDSSETCKNMIAFVDRHYKFDASVRNEDGSEGDNGKNTVRENKLIEIIQEKLDPKKGGWRGGYLGGNGFLKTKNIKTLGDGSLKDGNRYYFSDQDIKLYYGSDYAASAVLSDVDSSWDVDKANRLLYPVLAADFNGTLGTSGGEIKMDAWYENARYRDFLIGSMTVLDSFGTPLEIQIPTKQALIDEGITSARTKYARIVSFGKDRRRDTPIDVLDIQRYLDTPGNEKLKRDYDDSVLYLFDVSDANLTSYFHPRDKE